MGGARRAGEKWKSLRHLKLCLPVHGKVRKKILQSCEFRLRFCCFAGSSECCIWKITAREPRNARCFEPSESCTKCLILRVWTTRIWDWLIAHLQSDYHPEGHAKMRIKGGFSVPRPKSIPTAKQAAHAPNNEHESGPRERSIGFWLQSRHTPVRTRPDGCICVDQDGKE